LATAAVLAGVGGLHAAWGMGSTFPFRDHETLADTVAGKQAVPKREECFAIAGLLGTAAVMVVRRRRLGSLGVAAVLGLRGAAGLTGNTERLVGWKPNDHFVDIDKRVYGPLCLALSAGALTSALSRR
jgi:hypothetical protein